MKKLVLLSLSLLMSVTAFAQVKVNVDNPEVSIQFKRCIATGNIAYLDFIMINNSGKEMALDLKMWSKDAIRAYDDEGNGYTSYDGDRVIKSIDFAGHRFTFYESDRRYVFPTEVPIKGRIEIRDVDEYATSFLKVIVDVYDWTYGTKYHNFKIEFKNVPITRQ